MQKVLIIVLIVLVLALAGILVWQNWLKPEITCQDGACTQQKCTDGTLNMECSINKEPLYCQSLKLVNNCKICGCPKRMICQQDNSCVKEEPPTVEPIIFALNKTYADKFPNWKQQADKIIDDVNFVFAKTTPKKFKISKYLAYNDSEYTNLFTTPENYPAYYNDVGSRGGITYILLVHKDGITNQELKQFNGSDTVNVMRIVYFRDKEYPTILQANNESVNILLDEFRPNNIQMPIHELGHCLGLGVPDWYFYQYSDCTGVNPKFLDYNIQKDPNFSKDPMANPLWDINVIQFSELNSAIINKNLNLLYTCDYIRLNWFSKITKVYVTDKSGLPISNAIVKIFCVKKGCFYCNTPCQEVQQEEQTLITDKNGYVTYNGPVGGWEMSETKNTPCIAKAIKVYYNGKSSVKVVNFIDLQKNYILNNSNEYITHIILE